MKHLVSFGVAVASVTPDHLPSRFYQISHTVLFNMADSLV